MDQVKIVYSQRQGCKNTSGLLASEMATWSLPNTFLQWFYRLVDTSITYSLTFVHRIAVQAWIYHSMSWNCLERGRSMPNRLDFADSNYWAETFLGTAGAMVPIFLQPCPKGGMSIRLKSAAFGDISEVLSTGLLVPDGQYQDVFDSLILRVAKRCELS